MEEQKFNKRITFSVIAVLLIVLVTIGATYAYFSAQAETGVQTVTTATIGLEFDDNSATVLAEDIIPVTTDKVLVDTKNVAHKNFKIKKVANAEDMYATIKLSNLNIPAALAKYDFKWMLMQGENKIATGDFGGKTSGSVVIATNQFINSTTGIDYDLYIWINETGISQNEMQGQTFSAKVVATGSASKLNTLASVLLGNNNANVAATQFNYSTDFTCTAPEDGVCTTNYTPGLYEQSGDVTKSEMGFPTYYYRGSVKNNYVQFGTHASDLEVAGTVRYNAGDPIIWRVVRINEDGSIKLISETEIAPGTAWGADTVDYLNSSLKTQATSWYNTTLQSASNLDSKVVTSSFCNDISGNYSSANAKLNNNNPTFVCSAGANLDYNKVGLITADEVYYSGVLRQNSIAEGSSYSYLYDRGDDGKTFTLTPGTRDTVLVLFGNKLSRQPVATASYIRAVINLSPDVVVSNADAANVGSSSTPYIIQ